MPLLDTLLSAFKGGERTRVPLASAMVNGWWPGLPTGPGAGDYRYDRAITEGFLANPIAQRSVRLVAEGIGQAPLHCPDPRLATLVTATSAGQSLIETLAAHLLLNGNAYVQIIKDASGTPVELFALRPDRVTVVLDGKGWPCGYSYTVEGRSNTTIALEDENGWPGIIPLRTMHPLADHHGASALQAAWQAVLIHNAATHWNRALLDNAARPSGALVYDTGDGMALTREQFDRLRQELDVAFSGATNAGRPMLLDGGLKWQSIALSPADMDFATLKSAAARDIALAFGVPPMLLGLPGDNTYANYREASRALWRLTLLPLAAKLFAAVCEGLAPWFPEAELRIDLDRVPALSEDRERLWSQVSEADFLSRAEKRQMLGLSPEETAP
jgi:HK97 family phage portal protein